MRARQKVSRAGVELIKSFEGLRSVAARLPDGRWTLGYGHTFSAREGARVTQEDADALLRFDLLPMVDAINNMVLVPLNQNQFDALVSFCFNIGVENFATSSVLKCINEGRMTEAALAMDSWRSAEFNGQTYVLAPLIRRRAAEKNLFLTPDESTGQAPSLLVRPMQDTAGDAAARPSELSAPERSGLSPYPMAAPGVSPYAQPSALPPQATAERQVIDLNAFSARPVDPGLSPYAAPRETPPPGPAETIVEHLPDAIVSPAAMREVAPVAAAAPVYAPPAVSDEPQMSPAVQAALARAQEEQRLQDEQRLRDEALRQAEVMAAARAAEEVRLQNERLDALRAEQERLQLEMAEQARAEQARLEQARLEQARLEQAKLEQEAFERSRLEREAAEREEMARQEQARLEQARLEQARLEQARLEQARLDQERLEREQQERERAAVQPAPAAAAPSSDEAEKLRKAEAAAALMRLYSPYGSGTLGRPLAAPAPQPVAAPQPQPYSATNPNFGQPSMGQPAFPGTGFSNQSVMTPNAPESAPEPVQVAQPEPQPVAATPVEPVAEVPEEDDNVVDFVPIGSARSVAPPTVVALNPYARPVAQPAPAPVAAPIAMPEPAPAIVEVPRPEPVDLSATKAADVFSLRPAPEPSPSLHWREQLQRPLPNDYQAEAAPAEQVNLINAPASSFESLYHDDNAEWTLDGGRIAVAEDDHDHEHRERNVWQMIMDTLWWILISGLGLGCLGVAAAAYTKSHDPAVIRNGFFNDYTSLSLIMAAVGILFVSISVWLIMKRLGGLKD